MIAEEIKFTWRVDIWAFGCIFFEILDGIKAFKSDFEVRESKGNEIKIPSIDFHFGSSRRFLTETIRSTVNTNPTERQSAAQLLLSFEQFDESLFQGRPKKSIPPKSSPIKTEKKRQTLPKIKSLETRSEKSVPTRSTPNNQIPPMTTPIRPPSTFQMPPPQMPAMPQMFSSSYDFDPANLPRSSTITRSTRPLPEPAELPSVPQMYPRASLYPGKK
jgi:hypothetical protein